MNYCPYCGKKKEESYKYCPFCGADLGLIETTDSVVQNSEDEGIKEEYLIHILTNTDSPFLMAAKPIPIQKDILNAIEATCQGVTPELNGDLMIDGIIRVIPDLLTTFVETVYDLDYDEYSIRNEYRKTIFNDTLNQMENDKQNYPEIETGKKRLKKANLTQQNFASLYCLRNSSYKGDTISTKDMRAGEHIDNNFASLIKYVRAIAMREACKRIARMDLKLKAACYWYTYYASYFGLKGYEAEVEGSYTTKRIVTGNGELAIYCIERNDALCRMSRQILESALHGENDNNAYEITEIEANQLISNAWRNIAVFATEQLGDLAPQRF